MTVHYLSGTRYGFPSRLSTLAAIVLLMGIVVFFLGSSNPVTPAGYVGYLTRGAIFGHERFVGLQAGPTSSGRGWLIRVTNVSVTPYTYDEDFSGTDTVLSSDGLKIAFRVHLVWRVRTDRVKQFVEQFSTLEPNDSADTIVQVAYRNFLREPLHTYARDEVQRYKGLEIKDNIARIGENLTDHLLTLTKDTPFEVRSIVVGNELFISLHDSPLAILRHAAQASRDASMVIRRTSPPLHNV